MENIEQIITERFTNNSVSRHLVYEWEDIFSLKSASNLNGNLNCSKELEHYAS